MHQTEQQQQQTATPWHQQSENKKIDNAEIEIRYQSPSPSPPGFPARMKSAPIQTLNIMVTAPPNLSTENHLSLRQQMHVSSDSPSKSLAKSPSKSKSKSRTKSGARRASPDPHQLLAMMNQQPMNLEAIYDDVPAAVSPKTPESLFVRTETNRSADSPDAAPSDHSNLWALGRAKTMHERSDVEPNDSELPGFSTSSSAKTWRQMATQMRRHTTTSVDDNAVATKHRTKYSFFPKRLSSKHAVHSSDNNNLARPINPHNQEENGMDTESVSLEDEARRSDSSHSADTELPKLFGRRHSEPAMITTADKLGMNGVRMPDPLQMDPDAPTSQLSLGTCATDPVPGQLDKRRSFGCETIMEENMFANLSAENLKEIRQRNRERFMLPRRTLNVFELLVSHGAFDDDFVNALGMKQ
eukprot:CAMPEP_0197081386 /NCGR_PEP_ID=MMETSP1384-20130603/214610_1 /TAXON_ID=29189 /ORGANISM="Ammonia sp." /LENGTH=412 /DNA_ID=CAMNT_0042520281 /DNA_START=208 /DNA_END=1446 /DNA_ORIENTATION=-